VVHPLWTVLAKMLNGPELVHRFLAFLDRFFLAEFFFLAEVFLREARMLSTKLG
jgi:hypothetical protein